MIEPLHDRVLVERLKRGDAMKGGIIRPDTANDRPHHGRVLAVGPKVEVIRHGDVVMFGQYAGIIVADDSDLEVLLREEECLARVTAEPGWTAQVIVDPLGAPTLYDLGELTDGAFVCDEDRMFLHGALVKPIDPAAQDAIVAAGYATVRAYPPKGGDHPFTEIVMWRVDTVTLFRTGARFVAVAEADPEGTYGGSAAAPLGYVFKAGDPATVSPGAAVPVDLEAPAYAEGPPVPVPAVPVPDPDPVVEGDAPEGGGEGSPPA